ncbi:hypothetical protein Tco_1081970 [Tanacetum coccineum]|uniref:Transposase (Putative), gypsy type n=1 Tax=Tanacetum coccineum TaxID=301880 RepID=A0ABQ5HZF6_9ASTR
MSSTSLPLTLDGCRLANDRRREIFALPSWISAQDPKGWMSLGMFLFAANVAALVKTRSRPRVPMKVARTDATRAVVNRDATTTKVVQEPVLEKEVAAMGPPVNKRRRQRGTDEAEANAPPKVLRKDHATPHPAQSTHEGKSLAVMGLEAGSTFTPVAQETSTGAKRVKSSKGTATKILPQYVATTEVNVQLFVGSPDSRKSTSVPSVGWAPVWYISTWVGLDYTAARHLETLQDMVDHTVPPGYFSKLCHFPNTEFLGQYNMNLARQVAIGPWKRKCTASVYPDQTIGGIFEAEERIKAAFEEFKKYEDDKVEQRCAEMDARLDALSIDFDEELYPHMLTAIAGRQWVIRHGLRLAVMKCAESTKLRQVFADVVSAGIVKGMSEGLKHGVEHGEAKLDLAAIEAYDPEADVKYVSDLQALKDLKFSLVDLLEKLKDATIDLIMTSLHLESDFGEDVPQWIRELRPSSSQLKIPVYPEARDPKDPLSIKEEILLEDAIATKYAREKSRRRKWVVFAVITTGRFHPPPGLTQS